MGISYNLIPYIRIPRISRKCRSHLNTGFTGIRDILLLCSCKLKYEMRFVISYLSFDYAFFLFAYYYHPTDSLRTSFYLSSALILRVRGSPHTALLHIPNGYRTFTERALEYGK